MSSSLVANVLWATLQRKEGAGFRVNKSRGTVTEEVRTNVPNDGKWSSWINLGPTCPPESDVKRGDCGILFEIDVRPGFEVELKGERKTGSDMVPSDVFRAGKINVPKVFYPGCRSEYQKDEGSYTDTRESNKRHNQCPPIRRFSDKLTVDENKVFLRARREGVTSAPTSSPSTPTTTTTPTIVQTDGQEGRTKDDSSWDRTNLLWVVGLVSFFMFFLFLMIMMTMLTGSGSTD